MRSILSHHIVVTTILCFAFSTGTYAQKPYLITGNVKGLEEGAVIRLMQDEGNLFTMIASDTVHKERFQLKGTVSELTALAITGVSQGFPSMWLDVWVQPGENVRISGNNKLLKTWQVESSIKEQKSLAKFTNASRTQLDQLQHLSAQESPLFEQIEGADTKKRKQIKKSIDSLRTLQDSLRIIVNRNDLALLPGTKRDAVWMNTLKSLAMSVRYGTDSTLRPSVVQHYQSLTATERNSLKAAEIKNYLFPPVVVQKGEKIADTILKDLEGKSHRLSDYKGKYMIIDFWSIGCGPCISAMPELKKLHETMSDRLTVVSFTIDRKHKTWKEGSEHVKLNWLNLSDEKGNMGLAAKYGVSGIPHYVMISPEGLLLDSWVGYEEGMLTKKVQEYIH